MKIEQHTEQMSSSHVDYTDAHKTTLYLWCYTVREYTIEGGMKGQLINEQQKIH